MFFMVYTNTFVARIVVHSAVDVRDLACHVLGWHDCFEYDLRLSHKWKQIFRMMNEREFWFWSIFLFECVYVLVCGEAIYMRENEMEKKEGKNKTKQNENE